eukprot:Nitzschia sp. Nitz4//scaffold117_size69655//27204//28340//NITZ4_006023-RA/size69655-snap-gene-0.8-mRNA-1//-1//CDS//3329533648//6479//frame0
MITYACQNHSHHAVPGLPQLRFFFTLTTTSTSTMGRSDVTYLESFIEHIATMPAEVRRNLELMKDLDQSAKEMLDEMVFLQDEYMQRVEQKIGNLEVVEDGTKVRVLGDAEDRPAVVPTTEELTAFVREPETLKYIENAQEDALQYAEEKVAIAQQTYTLIDNICKRLEADVEDMKGILQTAGDFQAPGAAKPDDLAAVQVIPGSPDWILAKVMSYDARTGMYKLADEDVESNKIFNLPENQVVILEGIKNLRQGDTVYAVYPDTTAFYQASIVQTARKVSGGGSFVMVHFVDDCDEHGITHDKAVLLEHIMRPPFGATLQ